MARYVESEVELSDGTVLPPHSRIMIAGRAVDPTAAAAAYPDPGPETFDAGRYLRRRQLPGEEHRWQMVATGPDHLLFGHGQHACPGRFFAVNEIKVALCYLLLRYDWRFVPGTGGRPAPDVFEAGQSVKPGCQVQVRRRTAEVDLDSLRSAVG